MINKYSSFVLVAICLMPLLAGAQSNNPESAYKLIGTINLPALSVPRVIEVPLPNASNRDDALVTDAGNNKPVPSMVKYLYRSPSPVYRATGTVPSGGTSLSSLADNNPATFAEFPISEQGSSVATISLQSDRAVTASSLRLQLDAHVALPKTITLRATTANGSSLILENQQMSYEVITFPKVTATAWQITLAYGQLLRISEIHLDDDVAQSEGRVVRFLAQPGHSYVLYLDPDRYVPVNAGESADLTRDEGVLRVSAVVTGNNPNYVMADSDRDNIPDIADNCVSTSNIDQIDTDGNGRGDACDDFDRDGVINSLDNCKDNPNRDQLDTDGDKIGDACDTEESRVTEKYPWLPWTGMGLAALVLVVLVLSTANIKKQI